MISNLKLAILAGLFVVLASCSSTQQKPLRLYGMSQATAETLPQNAIDLGLSNGNIVLLYGLNDPSTIINVTIVDNEISCKLTASKPYDISGPAAIELFSLATASECIPSVAGANAIGETLTDNKQQSEERRYAVKIIYRSDGLHMSDLCRFRFTFRASSHTDDSSLVSKTRLAIALPMENGLVQILN